MLLLLLLWLVTMPWPQNERQGRGLVREWARNGREAQVGRWREKWVASQEDGMKIFEGGVLGNGERERRKRRK